MNERIRELAEQAGIDFFNSTDPEYCGREYCEAWTEQQQKFAELIVRECIKVVDNMANPEDSERYFWAIQNVSSEIKEHFGVER